MARTITVRTSPLFFRAILFAVPMTMLSLIPQISAQAIKKDDPENITLVQCISSNMHGDYADAKSTAYASCLKETQIWLQSCEKKTANCSSRTANCLDGAEMPTCREQFRVLTKGMTAQWEIKHPVPPPAVDVRMESALADFRAGNALPGLPRVDKKIYAIKGGVVCETPGALNNKNREVTLTLKVCRSFNAEQIVRVFSPAHEEEYVADHYMKMIQIAWDPEQMSEAAQFTGWIKISDLRN